MIYNQQQFLLDGMIVDYLMIAMQGDYHPDSDTDEKLRYERVAAFRLYLWANCAIAPTAATQIRSTPDQERRDALDRVIGLLLAEPSLSDEEQPMVCLRVLELRAHHKNEADCSIVAEAEALGFNAVVTFDKKMRRRLAPHARVRLLGPSEAWGLINVPKGIPPSRLPDYTNPKFKDSWWRWE